MDRMRGKRCAEGFVVLVAASGEAADDSFEAGLCRIVETPLIVHRT
jgi:hypothetical protein